jgi:hypothetical protein
MNLIFLWLVNNNNKSYLKKFKTQRETQNTNNFVGMNLRVYFVVMYFFRTFIVLTS